MRGTLSLVALLLLSVACSDGNGLVESGPDVRTARIGPEGGRIISADNVLHVVIPPGALSGTREIRVYADDDAPEGTLGVAYRIEPNQGLDANATYLYDFSAMGLIDREASQVTIASHLGADWIALPRLRFDASPRRVTAEDPNLAIHYGLIDLPESASGSESATDTGDTAGEADTSTTEPNSSDTDTNMDTDTSGNPDGSDSDTGRPGGSEGSGDAVCSDGRADRGELCLIEGLSVSTTGLPSALLVVDADGDGDNDAIAVGGTDDELQIHFNNGSGVPTQSEVYPIGSGPSDLAWGDLDGDGLGDLVVTDAEDSEVGVLLNEGNGQFSDYAGIGAGGQGSIAITLADFDPSSTNLDVAIANSTTPNLSVLFGDGTGAFAAETAEIPLDAAPVAIDHGDFDGNGTEDLVAVGGNNLLLSAGNGTGSFGEASPTELPTDATALAVADFNEDSNVDVFVATSDGVLQVFLGNGIGGFGAAIPFTVGANPVRLTTGDVDGDGNVDVVSVDQDDDTITLLRGTGTGGVAATNQFEVGDQPSDVAIGDFNGDDVPDILVTNLGDDGISLLLSDP